MDEQSQDDLLETYIQQLWTDTGCSPDDLPEVMDDRGGVSREGKGYRWLMARHDDDYA